MKSLDKCQENKIYTIAKIETKDEEMKKFLFTLGCFEGEKISIISKLEQNFIITIKDARYSIDSDLAAVIQVVE